MTVAVLVFIGALFALGLISAIVAATALVFGKGSGYAQWIANAVGAFMGAAALLAVLL